jgi:NAD(P)-dependent dehydrogenase (short-subunit alcohol dehydrogenase family)
MNSKVQVLTVKADIAVEKDVENLYAEVQKAFGRHADVLLNNAGYLDDDNLIGEQKVDEWWTGFVSCHLLSLLYTTLRHLDDIEDLCGEKLNESRK